MGITVILYQKGADRMTLSHAPSLELKHFKSSKKLCSLYSTVYTITILGLLLLEIFKSVSERKYQIITSKLPWQKLNILMCSLVINC